MGPGPVSTVLATAEDEPLDAAADPMDYYGIDIADLTIYDLSINTARWDPDDVLAMLTTAVENYERESDEGKYPITGVTYDF